MRGPNAGQIAIDEAHILARALMSFSARRMNYGMAAHLAIDGFRLPLDAWVKVVSEDYGDWYVRVLRDGMEYSGESTGTYPGEVSAEVVVPANSTPVTDVLRKFVVGLDDRPSAVLDRAGFAVVSPSFLAAPYANSIAMLKRSIEACDPAHRHVFMEDLLGLYKSPEESSELLDRLRAYESYAKAEHGHYACDALVPALAKLMVAVLECLDSPLNSPGIQGFVAPLMHTSVGVIRDRFLSSPPLGANPAILVQAATKLMSQVDEAIHAARRAETVNMMLDILFDVLPDCIAAHWLLTRAKDGPIGGMSNAAAAMWRRTDETFARVYPAFLHQLLDLTGQGWERLVLDHHEVREPLGPDAARKSAKLHFHRHLVYPTILLDKL